MYRPIAHANRCQTPPLPSDALIIKYDGTPMHGFGSKVKYSLLGNIKLYIANLKYVTNIGYPVF